MLDKEDIRKLEMKIQSDYANMAGIVVMKDGDIAYEKYFHECQANHHLHVFSVTKSIVSILVGIAYDRGYFENLDQKALDFFPHYQVKKREKTIQDVTFRNLLTMTAPYKYKINPYTKYFSSDDWVVASLDVLGGKGSVGKFRYAPIIGPDIISGVLENVLGRSLFTFAQESLFGPLEIDVEKQLVFRDKEEQMAFYKSKNINGWVCDPSGHQSVAWGLTLSPRDMAKLGQLYLQKGRWKDTQIVSEKWVKESTQVQSCWEKRNLHYGYLWWVIDEEKQSFAALGDGGNVIYVNPLENLVISIASYFVHRTKDHIDFIKEDVEPLFR